MRLCNYSLKNSGRAVQNPNPKWLWIWLMLIYLSVFFVTSPVSIQTFLPSAKRCNEPNAMIKTSVSTIWITMFDGAEHFERWKNILESASSWLHLYSSSVFLTINPSSLQNERHVSPLLWTNDKCKVATFSKGYKEFSQGFFESINTQRLQPDTWSLLFCTSYLISSMSVTVSLMPLKILIDGLILSIKFI